MSNETIHVKATGEIRDIITYEDGTVVDTGWANNIIVTNFNILIAGLLKGDVTKGIAFWAIGSGEESWDTTTPQPLETDVGCKTEFYRKAIPSNATTYVDVNGNTTAYPTNRIQISLLFDKLEGVGKWREFSIFGGNGATTTKDSGLALNHRTHGLIDKTENMTVERVLRFTFL